MLSGCELCETSLVAVSLIIYPLFWMIIGWSGHHIIQLIRKKKNGVLRDQYGLIRIHNCFHLMTDKQQALREKTEKAMEIIHLFYPYRDKPEFLLNKTAEEIQKDLRCAVDRNLVLNKLYLHQLLLEMALRQKKELENLYERKHAMLLQRYFLTANIPNSHNSGRLATTMLYSNGYNLPRSDTEIIDLDLTGTTTDEDNGDEDDDRKTEDSINLDRYLAIGPFRERLTETVDESQQRPESSDIPLPVHWTTDEDEVDGEHKHYSDSSEISSFSLPNPFPRVS